MTTPESQHNEAMKLSTGLRRKTRSELAVRVVALVGLFALIFVLVFYRSGPGRTAILLVFSTAFLIGILDLAWFLSRAGFRSQFYVSASGLIQMWPSGSRRILPWESLTRVVKMNRNGEVLLFKAGRFWRHWVLVDSFLDQPITPLGIAIDSAMRNSPAESIVTEARRRHFSYQRWRMDRKLRPPVWRWHAYVQVLLVLCFAGMIVPISDDIDLALLTFLLTGWAIMAIWLLWLIRRDLETTRLRIQDFDARHPEIKTLLDSGEIEWHWWQTKP